MPLTDLQAMIATVINVPSSLIWNLLIYLLLGCGLFFTVRTRFIQFRLLGRGWCEMAGSRHHVNNHSDISPFQAFATGLASRVGSGNIAGVATAISVGGPGAIFWMWITALLGMASAFAESTLGQLFKVPHHDNTFRGGPAYYIQQGLRSRGLGIAFALTLILAFGLVFNALQANTIVTTVRVWNWNPQYVGIALVLLTGPIIFGGLRSVARVAAWLVPFMALLYLLLAVYVVITHLDQLPGVLLLIVNSAFGVEQAVGGVAGHAVKIAMEHGIKRGLFSNEAGMGSAPNAAAAATTSHPASQGLLQMFGVFIDTIVICSCSAFIVLLSGAFVPAVPQTGGMDLAQKAIAMVLGDWGHYFAALAIFLFCFTSIIGNYAYAEGNVEFIRNNKYVMLLFRLLVLATVMAGSLGEVQLVWDMADLSMGLMALINLAAILLLSRHVLVVQRDYEQQLQNGVTQPVFDIHRYPALEASVGGDVWQRPPADSEK